MNLGRILLILFGVVFVCNVLNAGSGVLSVSLALGGLPRLRLACCLVFLEAVSGLLQRTEE